MDVGDQNCISPVKKMKKDTREMSTITSISCHLWQADLNEGSARSNLSPLTGVPPLLCGLKDSWPGMVSFHERCGDNYLMRDTEKSATDRTSQPAPRLVTNRPPAARWPKRMVWVLAKRSSCEQVLQPPAFRQYYICYIAFFHSPTICFPNGAVQGLSFTHDWASPRANHSQLQPGGVCVNF